MGAAAHIARTAHEGVAYYPSSDWGHGVVVSPAGEVDLWDATSGRKLTKLDLEGEIQSVSFSPDDSLFAVTSVRQNKDQSSTFHLRTWETKSGKFVHELMPLENVDHDEIGDPMWGVNGKYLLAPIRERRIRTYVIGIWNVQSGRYRGGFSGCDYSDDPFSILLQGQRLFKRCRDDALFMWMSLLRSTRLPNSRTLWRGHRNIQQLPLPCDSLHSRPLMDANLGAFDGPTGARRVGTGLFRLFKVQGGFFLLAWTRLP